MKRTSVFGIFRRWLRPYRAALTAALLCALGGSVCLLTAPLLIGEAIDTIRPEGGFGIALLHILLKTAALYAAGCLLTRFTTLLANRIAGKAVQSVRTETFDKLGRLPLSFFDATPRGDIISRFTNDIDAIADGLNQGIVQLLTGVISVLMCLGFMLRLDWRVALVAVFVTPLCFLMGFFITKYGSRRFCEQAKVLGELNGFAEEQISGERTLKAFGAEAAAAERFDALNRHLYETGYRAQFASALVNPTTRFVNNVAYVLVGVFGLMAGLSVGQIASFLTYTAQYAKPFNEITSVTMQLQLAAAAARRIAELLDTPEQSEEPDTMPALPSGEGEVGFSHVRFAYTPERPLITDFNLKVTPGQTVAIVGPTGAGKTTMVNLLMRFYELDGGTIEIDGQDIALVTRDSLRRQFGMVLQETWLFAGTIRDNIAYGREDATDEEILAAAKAAHAHSFIRRLPDGYQTVLPEDGGSLSAGQKQLLTIARVMLLDPPMLILDEATSSVDILTEQKIQKAFLTMMQGRTSFIIAHRLSTIRHADRILVLEHGDVAEIGTHEELLRRDGAYSRLYKAQFAPT